MNGGDWVEIGWYKRRNDDGSVDLFRFTEWGDDGVALGFNLYLMTPDYGNYDGWQVYWDSGIGDWRMLSDLNDDGIFGELDNTGNGITWNRGADSGRLRSPARVRA